MIILEVYDCQFYSNNSTNSNSTVLHYRVRFEENQKAIITSTIQC